MGKRRFHSPRSTGMGTLLAVSMALTVTITSDAVEMGGYYKNLAVGSKTVIGPSQHYWQDINRLRLTLSESWQHVDLDIQYDNELQTGDYLDTFQFRQQVDQDDPRYWTLQGETVDKGDLYAKHGLYRGTIKLATPWLDLRFGRQQINWATAAIWNPMDRFNPLNPLQLERDERLGVDAILADVNIDDLSRLSVAYAPQHDPDERAYAMRYKSHWGEMDWSVMAGEFANVDKLAASVAGAIGLVGIRSEWVYSRLPLGKESIEWVVGVDYTTQSGLSWLVESYFNGGGAASTNTYDFRQLITGQTLGLARHYLGGKLAKDISPLLTVELYGVINMDDHSRFVYPSFNYAVPGFDDLYISGGAQLFQGQSGDEYGFFNHLYFAELKAYF